MKNSYRRITVVVLVISLFFSFNFAVFAEENAGADEFTYQVPVIDFETSMEIGTKSITTNIDRSVDEDGVITVVITSTTNYDIANIDYQDNSLYNDNSETTTIVYKSSEEIFINGEQLTVEELETPLFTVFKESGGKEKITYYATSAVNDQELYMKSYESIKLDGEFVAKGKLREAVLSNSDGRAASFKMYANSLTSAIQAYNAAGIASVLAIIGGIATTTLLIGLVIGGGGYAAAAAAAITAYNNGKEAVENAYFLLGTLDSYVQS